jgi:hypothetical protein
MAELRSMELTLQGRENSVTLLNELPAQETTRTALPAYWLGFELNDFGMNAQFSD